jgi:hypothetical protein
MTRQEANELADDLQRHLDLVTATGDSERIANACELHLRVLDALDPEGTMAFCREALREIIEQTEADRHSNDPVRRANGDEAAELLAEAYREARYRKK